MWALQPHAHHFHIARVTPAGVDTTTVTVCLHNSVADSDIIILCVLMYIAESSHWFSLFRSFHNVPCSSSLQVFALQAMS